MGGTLMKRKIILLILIFAAIVFCNNIIFEKSLVNKVNTICSNIDIGYSSNAYDYINARQDIFNNIVSEGNAAVKVFVNIMKKDESSGLDEYVMAVACSEITGIGKDSSWSSASEWLVLYEKEN
jgi:hypothetical protein